MKKIILLAAITVFGVATSNAQTAKKAVKKADAPVKVETQKVDGPGIVFENETIDYGTIPHNSDGNREFVFVNNGNKPLKIESTQGSCGCTVPVWPRTPIKPGDSAEVLANFNTAGKPNRQAKTLTLFTNTARGREILKLKGSVTPKASSIVKK